MGGWPGWTDEDTLILPLDDAPPASAVAIGGRRFEPKGELHLTLVGTTLGRELRAVFGDRLDAATRPAFKTLDWSPERTGVGALVERRSRAADGDTVASIVEMVELPALGYFHRWLGGLLGRELPLPPPHVTLYTHGGPRGIGIPSARALKGLVRGRVDLSALRPA